MMVELPLRTLAARFYSCANRSELTVVSCEKAVKSTGTLSQNSYIKMPENHKTACRRATFL